ncbi:hypothetical protein ACFYYB_32970 [Streptomyces sp. NPDC002886]|uniref:hypothetical protein n=1 Tax=Streptomyces sp. NPDC002886 TaxID=3364667 RepID=UPI00367F0F11
MPDLLWDDVRNFFDPDLMGALPDVCVPDASAADWEAVFDLIRSSGWTWEYSEGGVAGPLPSAAEVLSRPADADTVELRVWPVPDVLAIFRPMSADEIDFDVDLNELQGQAGVDTLCDFLRAIGRRLGKPVVMTGEGDYANPVLGFDPTADCVVLLADPRLIELAGPPAGHLDSDEATCAAEVTEPNPGQPQ